MKIRYLSDLHLEFLSEKSVRGIIDKIKSDSGSLSHSDEVCVLAGDIGYPSSDNYKIFMEFINDYFVKSFMITGNCVIMKMIFLNQINGVVTSDLFTFYNYRLTVSFLFINHTFV